MPNFQTKTLKEVKFPASLNQVEFLWNAKNTDERGNEELIFARYKDEEFFLKKLERKSNILIKGDKLAKPSRVKLLQDALIAYEELCEAKSVFSNIRSSKNHHEKKNDILKDIDFFANTEFLSGWKRACIEVGFGSGRHLLHQAKTHPDTLFIGAEIHKPSIEQVVKQCEMQGIKNILIVDFDARVLVEFFPANSVSQIFVHFPIPWDKKPFRRVISKEFVSDCKTIIEKGGTLELRTDSDNFFAYSFEVMMSLLNVSLKIDKNKDIEITSKYEARWKKMEKNIYDLTLINEEYSSEKNLPKALKFDILVEKNSFKNDTVLEKDFFVHFENEYEMQEGNFLWRVAFGDTAHVNHCYVVVQNGKASYFPRTLYATKSNLKAHEIIKERLVNG